MGITLTDDSQVRRDLQVLGLRLGHSTRICQTHQNKLEWSPPSDDYRCIRVVTKTELCCLSSIQDITQSNHSLHFRFFCFVQYSQQVHFIQMKRPFARWALALFCFRRKFFFQLGEGHHRLVTKQNSSTLSKVIILMN